MPNPENRTETIAVKFQRVLEAALKSGKTRTPAFTELYMAARSFQEQSEALTRQGDGVDAVAKAQASEALLTEFEAALDRFVENSGIPQPM